MAKRLICGVLGTVNCASFNYTRKTDNHYRCIFFELLTGDVAFRGKVEKDQLVLLFKTLGTPTEVLKTVN